MTSHHLCLASLHNTHMYKKESLESPEKIILVSSIHIFGQKYEASSGIELEIFLKILVNVNLAKKATSM